MLLRLTTVVVVALLWVPVANAWSWPVKGPVLQTFQYDEASPYAAGQHRGIDIRAAADGDPVLAPAAGTVSFAGTVPTNGMCVTIATPDGYSVTLTHLGSIAVSRGASVEEGAVVGTVGPSGTPDFSVPYVHLGIRLSADANGYVDPLGLLPPLAAPPPPQTGGSSGSAGSGVAAGTGGDAGSSSGSTPAEPSAPAPVAAISAEKSGGAGLVVRAQPSAPAARQTVSDSASATSAAPRRPTHVERRPAETAGKPRRFEGEFEGHVLVDRDPAVPARPVAADPAGAPYVLAVGPGVVATLAALMVAVCRRRRRRPPGVVVRFPRELEMRRAA